MEGRRGKREEARAAAYRRVRLHPRIAPADTQQQSPQRGHPGGRDHGHVQLRQPLHQRTAHRAAAHGMERRGAGRDKGEQYNTDPHRTAVHQHHRDHADQACA